MPHRNVQRAKKLQSLQGKNCLELAFDKLGSYEVALVNRPVLLPSFSTKPLSCLGETFLELSTLSEILFHQLPEAQSLSKYIKVSLHQLNDIIVQMA